MRTKSFLNLRFDLMLSFHFNRIIKTNLGTRCIKLGTHKLYDDTTDPDKINDSLNLLGKLLKYSNADNCYRELELFGTSLGTIIDPKLKTIIDSKKLRTVYADWYESGKFFK